MTQTRTGLVAGPPIIVLRACLFRECRRGPFLHPIPEGLPVIRADHPTRQEFRVPGFTDCRCAVRFPRQRAGILHHE